MFALRLEGEADANERRVACFGRDDPEGLNPVGNDHEYEKWLWGTLATIDAAPQEICLRKVTFHNNEANLPKPRRPRPTTLAGRIAAPFWAFSRMVYGH